MMVGRRSDGAVPDPGAPAVTVPAVPPAEGDPARGDWSRAADLGQWATLVGEPTTRKVEGRVAHDGHYLYVQLAEELDPATLVASPQVFDGDDWEGFFATQRGAGARQICVGPKGAHLAVARGEEKETWDSGAVVVSDTVDGRWRVRLALPLARLVPGGAKPGEVVYAGFYRASPGARDLLAWSPTFGGGFHNTNRLGELVLEPTRRQPEPGRCSRHPVEATPWAGNPDGHPQTASAPGPAASQTRRFFDRST